MHKESKRKQKLVKVTDLVVAQSGRGDAVPLIEIESREVAPWHESPVIKTEGQASSSASRLLLQLEGAKQLRVPRAGLGRLVQLEVADNTLVEAVRRRELLEGALGEVDVLHE